jgi:hypothetical protein
MLPKLTLPPELAHGLNYASSSDDHFSSGRSWDVYVEIQTGSIGLLYLVFHKGKNSFCDNMHTSLKWKNKSVSV